MSVKCVDGVYEKHPVDVTIAVPLQRVRTCFEGPMIARCRAIAELTPIQRERLFPERRRSHCWGMMRIARRLRLKEHDGSHEPCEHCKVIRALITAPFDTLAKAAKYESPAEQLRAAASKTLLG